MKVPKKIAVVGPESTGKSSVVKFLSSYFQASFVHEFAREYCEGLNRNYTMEDELAMFHGQLQLEQIALDNFSGEYLFFDTMILNIKIWCDELFGYTPQMVLDEIEKVDFDLYLLMDIDLPWEDDPLRDFPDKREYFMDVWKRELEDIGANYVVISGLGEERYQNALKAVQQFA